MRDTQPAKDKMENQLEIEKENKPSSDKAEDVAGRKEKGSVTGLLQKMTGDPGKKS